MSRVSRLCQLQRGGGLSEHKRRSSGGVGGKRRKTQLNVSEERSLTHSLRVDSSLQ